MPGNPGKNVRLEGSREVGGGGELIFMHARGRRGGQGRRRNPASLGIEAKGVEGCKAEALRGLRESGWCITVEEAPQWQRGWPGHVSHFRALVRQRLDSSLAAMRFSVWTSAELRSVATPPTCCSIASPE